MTTLLPQDANNNPIPALRPRTGGAHALSVEAASVRNGTAFDAKTRVISLYATGDIYIRLGHGDVEAASTDHFFPAATYYDISLGHVQQGPASHLAAIAAGAPCILYISEKE